MFPGVNSHRCWHQQCYRLFSVGIQKTHLFIYNQLLFYLQFGYIFFGRSLLNIHLGPGEAGCSAHSSFHSRSSKTPVKTCPTDSAARPSILLEELNIPLGNRHKRTQRLWCELYHWIVDTKVEINSKNTGNFPERLPASFWNSGPISGSCWCMYLLW